MKATKIPPYSITSIILEKIEAIGKELGSLEVSLIPSNEIQLRKENKIRTIQSSLAIEGNTLSLEDVSSLLEGKRVIGPNKDILEVKNAIKVYKNLNKWNGLDINSFLSAHEQLMHQLIPDKGKWRTAGVGLYKGDKLKHMAPPASRVENLMHNLFAYINADKSPWLIKACVFHYELEFIHPFSDGNGRMGRLWQQILLMRNNSIFEFIPVEEIIKRHQMEYYDVLSLCDSEANSTAFIEFSLDKIHIALKEMPRGQPKIMLPIDRLNAAKDKLSQPSFTRKEYAEIFGISTATASRDLLKGIQKGKLLKTGDKATAKYVYVNL